MKVVNIVTKVVRVVVIVVAPATTILSVGKILFWLSVSIILKLFTNIRSIFPLPREFYTN